MTVLWTISAGTSKMERDPKDGNDSDMGSDSMMTSED